MKYFKLTYSVLIFLFASSCGLFEEDEEPDNSFSFISQFDNTEFNGYMTLDDQPVVLTGAFVDYTDNSAFQDIIVSIAPPNSSGSIIFPGDGWVQFRFHVDEVNGTVVSVPTENDFTVSSFNEIETGTFNGLYNGPNNEKFQIQNTGRVTNNSFSRSDDDSYNFSFSFESESGWVNIGASSDIRSGSVGFSISTSGTASEDEVNPDANNTNTDDGSNALSSCTSSYDGPLFDIQIDSQCQAAWSYACAGNLEGVRVSCEIYNSFKALGNVPDCPYCN